MIVYVAFIGGLFGLAAGSFLGVVIERGSKLKYQNSKIISGRSRCSACYRQLEWWENIPICSFILLKGRCSRCYSPIPYWLPLIEIAGAAVGVWLAQWASQTIIVINFITVIKVISAIAIAIALIWIFFSDLVYGVISDWAVLIGSAGAIAMSLMGQMRLMGLMIQSVTALGAGAFFWFLVVITRGRGMGTGDITLAFFLGLWLGWPLVALGIWFGFVIGAIWGIGLIALRKKKFGQTIPFGPFLIVGSLVALQWGQAILDRWLWFVVK